MVQSVFDHSQLLIGDSFHAPFLRDVLAQQAIEVLVAATLPAAIRIGKVGLDAQGLIDGLGAWAAEGFDLPRKVMFCDWPA